MLKVQTYLEDNIVKETSSTAFQVLNKKRTTSNAITTETESSPKQQGVAKLTLHLLGVQLITRSSIS